MKNLEKVNGITLIALVVTIIILLILAGVSFSMIISENGLLTQSKKAIDVSEAASKGELKQLAMAHAMLNTETTIYKGIKIPAGFAPTQIDGEDSINEGLVIIDSNGNEFVWIDVPKNSEIYKQTGTDITNFDDSTYINIENDLKEYVKDYRNINRNENASDTWQENCYLDRISYTKLKNSMLKSIYTDKGFWVGRYEVGYEGDVRYNENNGYSQNINIIPVIKEGAYPLNWICYPQAQKISNSINYGEYEGSVLFGLQWDLICKFIEINNGKNKDEIIDDSRSWGNYRNSVFDITKGEYSVDHGKTFNKVSGSYTKGEYETGYGVLLTTGANQRNSVLNIYDFAGNLFEFTLELLPSSIGMSVITRGGSYRNDGMTWTPYDSGNITYGASYSYMGFRMTLIPNNI